MSTLGERPALHKHQEQALSAIAERRAEKKPTLVVAPPGAGKSRIMLELIKSEVENGGSACMYVHRKMLLEQARSAMEAWGFRYGVVSASQPKLYDSTAPVQLCSIDTVAARAVRRGTIDLPEATLVMVDEAHMQSGDKGRSVILGARGETSSFQGHVQRGAYVLGFTATPILQPGIYQDLVECGTYSQLRQCKMHLPVVTYSPTEIDTKGLRRLSSGEFDSAGLTGRAMMIFGDVFEHWIRLNPNRTPTILFGPSVEGARWFAEQFLHRGVISAAIDGERVMLPRRTATGQWIHEPVEASTAAREELLSRSRSGEIEVVCCRHVLREAVDMPWLTHAIGATVFGGLATYLQSIGRIQRYCSSVDQVIFLDHGGSYWRHGSANQNRHWELGMTAESVAEARIKQLQKAADSGNTEAEGICCSKCSGWRLRGPQCPHCGHASAASVRRVRMASGELQSVRGPVMQPAQLKKQTGDPMRFWRTAIFSSARSHRTVRQAIARYHWICKKEGAKPLPETFLKPQPPRDMKREFLVAHVWPWTLKGKSGAGGYRQSRSGRG